jgi:DNA-binding response OmpR family regulator
MKKHFILIILFCFCLGATNAQERTVLSFNQDWAFKKAPASSELIQNMQTWGNGWQPVELPHTWNAKDMQVKANNFYEGVGYYKKTYFFPKELAEKRVFLRFEGVGACAEVFVNGELATAHRGAYAAFACEIGKLLKAGENNEIIVQVDNQARPDVSYDETEIEKVVFNLLTNAFKFTPELGTVTLYLRRAKQEELNGVDSTESYLYLEVKDTGVGFSEEEKGKIFEPFYSFKNDLHQSIQGTGIGLHLSRSIVKLHGGHIFAESQPHEGSRFIVLLPDTEKQDETSDSATGTAVSETVEKTKLLLEEVDSRKKPTVLIVDDDAEICDYLTGQLGKDYHVFTAKNGREAFFKIGEVHPQLIVSDVVMPEMNGVELCRKIKETPETAHLPVILLTAKSAVSQIEEGLNTGADDYITKPFNISLLKARIRNILSSVNKKSEFNSSSDILRALGLHADAGKDDFLIQYIDIVKENIANPELDITYIYNRLGMSRANFYRKVKNLTGLSPIDLIRNIRVEFGAHLLKNTDLNISEIAQQTGFNSRSYFAKSFKTVYGITPTEYLKREKGRN